MKTIYIKELIRDRKYDYLKEFNIKIYKIKILKDTMEMKVFLESDNILVADLLKL